MNDIATLGLKVDSRPVKKATGDLREFASTGQRAERSAGALGAAFRGAALQMAVAVGAAVSVSAAFRSAQQLVEITNGFRGMGQSARQAAESLEVVSGIAMRTRAPLDATAQLYRRVSISARELGASQQEIANFTETVGLALASSGTSAQEASGALLQLSQAMAGGVVRAEEFNSILEGAPAIVLAAAQGIEEAGGSVGRLRQLMLDGEITSREFMDAILSQQEELQKAFDGTSLTFGQAMNNLNTGMTLLFGMMNEASGLGEALAETINGIGRAAARAASFISENMETVAAVFDRIGSYALAAGAAIVASYIPAAVRATAATLAWARGVMTLRGALIRTGIGALIVGAGELIFWFSRLVSATGSFGEALKLMGEVALAVWKGLIDSAAAIPPALNGVWQQMQAGFLSALSIMATNFHDFMWGIANSMAQVPGLEAMADDLFGVAEAASAASGRLMKASGDAAARAEGAFEKAGATIKEAFKPANEAITKIRDLVKKAGEDAEDATDAATESQDKFTDALEGTGGAAGKAKEAVESAIDALKRQIREERELIGLGDDAVAQIEARRAVEEALAKDKLQWSELAKQALVEEMMLNRELQQQAERRSAIYQTLGSNLGRGDIGGALSGFGRIATDSFGNLITSSFEAGGNVFGGIWGGLKDGIKGVGTALSGIASGATGAMAGIGSALSSAMPVIGAVMAGVNLVKGIVGTTTKNFNWIDVTAGLGGITGNAGDNKTTSNMFGESTTNNYSSFGTPGAQTDKVAAQIRAEWAEMREGITGELQAIGLDAVDFLHGIRIEYDDSLHGNQLHEKLMEQLRGELNGAADEMVRASLAAAGLARDGETGAQAMQIVVGSFDALNQALDLTNRAVIEASAETLRWARELTDLSGGVDAFTANFNAFYQGFYTETERALELVENTTEAMQALGFAMPATRDGFRDLVLAQDLTTDAGREAYASLLALSGQMDQVFTDMENGVTALAQAVDATLSGAFADALNTLAQAQADLDRAAQAAANALDRRLTDAFRAVTSLIDDELRGLTDTARGAERRLDALNRALDGRSMGGVAETLMARASAMAELRGGIGDTDRLQAVLRTLNEPSAQLFGSFRDYAVDFARTSAVIRDQRDAAADQLSETERQIAALEATRAAVEAQYDAVRGIETLTGDSLDQAMQAFQSETEFYATQMAQLDGLLGQGDTIADLMAQVRDAMARVEQATLDMGRAMEMLAAAIINSLQRIGGTSGLQGLGAGAFQTFAADGSNAIFSQVGQDMLTGTAKAINDLYLETFGRAADAMGVQFYGDLLEQGKVSLGRVAYDLATSNEVRTGLTPGFGGRLSNANPVDPVEALYGSMLGRTPDPAGVEFWKSTGLTGDALINAFRDGALASGEVPKFARGGMHTGGLRIVGENGPELEYTGPSRIYSAGDTRRMLDNREMVEELRRLRQAVARLEAYERQTSINTSKQSRILTDWDRNGQAPERAAL